MQKMFEIGLLSSEYIDDFRYNTLKPIINDDRFKISVIIIDKRKPLSIKQKIMKNFKRGRGGYMLIMLFKKKFHSKREKYHIQSILPNVKVYETDNPYSIDFINKLKVHHLDVLLLMGGFGIVKKSMLTVSKIGVLSYHHGNMRKYRGMPPVFWEMYNNEKELSATIQVLSEGLDAGKPVEEISIPVIEKSYKKSLTTLYTLSEPMLYNALCKLYTGYMPIELKELGKVYTLPNLRQWLVFYIKLIFR